MTKNLVLVHGSWHNGTAWKKVKDILDREDIAVHTPTLTGFESFNRPAGKDIGLKVHIDDIVRLIEENDLHNVLLVGHSYSGFVIQGAADRMLDRIAGLVYLDAFVPENGDALIDYMSNEWAKNVHGTLVDDRGKTIAEGAQDAWLMHPGEPQNYGVTDPADVDWLQDHLVWTPILTFEEALTMQDQSRVRAIPSAFVRCTAFEFLARWEEKARGLGWKLYQVPTGHDAMVTEPQAVADILCDFIKELDR